MSTQGTLSGAAAGASMGSVAGPWGMAAGAVIGGILGSAQRSKPRYDPTAMNEAYRLINEQYGNINTYFDQANQAFEGQYNNYYGQQIQDTVNQIAGGGLYESPVSQNVLNRQQIALGDVYAGAKSQLAGQKLSAIGQIDQQKISYYQTLAGIQNARQQDQLNRNNQMYATIGGLGTSLASLKK